MRVRVPRSSHSGISDDQAAPMSPEAAPVQQTGPAASQKLKLRLGSPKQPGVKSPNSHVGLDTAQAPAGGVEPVQAAHGKQTGTANQQQRKPRVRPPKQASRAAAIEVLANGASPSATPEQQAGQQNGQQSSKQQPKKRRRSRKEPQGPATAADSDTDAGICDSPKQRRRSSNKKAPSQQQQQQEQQQQQHAGGDGAAGAALQAQGRKSGRPLQPKVRPLSPTGRPPRPRKPRGPRKPKPAASGSTGATPPPPPAPQQQQQQEKQPSPQQKQEKQKQDKKKREKQEKQQQQQQGEGQHRDDVYKKAVRRAANYVHRIKAEEHAIHTYAADGWKGASREKVQLTDELQQAQARMARCQAAIQAAVRVCEEAQGDTAIAADLFDSDGELDETHIFCACCRGRDSHDDNDIILCDGPCNRAYHECCLSPRIRAGELPEEEGWLCPACDAKADIMHELNDVFGTSYTIDTRWQDLFSPEQEQLRLQRLCSDPLSPRALGGAAAAAATAAAGVGGAAGGALGVLLGGDLPSEDDSDFNLSEDGSAAHSLQQQSCSHDSGAVSSSGSEGEEVGTSTRRGSKSGSSPQQQLGSKRRRRSSGSGGGRHTRQQGAEPAEEDQEEAPGSRQAASGRRKPRVDYRALAREMFGGLDGHAEEDEDDEDYKHGR